MVAGVLLLNLCLCLCVTVVVGYSNSWYYPNQDWVHPHGPIPLRLPPPVFHYNPSTLPHSRLAFSFRKVKETLPRFRATALANERIRQHALVKMGLTEKAKSQLRAMGLSNIQLMLPAVDASVYRPPSFPSNARRFGGQTGAFIIHPRLKAPGYFANPSLHHEQQQQQQQQPMQMRETTSRDAHTPVVYFKTDNKSTTTTTTTSSDDEAQIDMRPTNNSNSNNDEPALLQNSLSIQPTSSIGMTRDVWLDKLKKSLLPSLHEPYSPYDYFSPTGPGRENINSLKLVDGDTMRPFFGAPNSPILSPLQDRNLDGFSSEFNYRHFGAQPLDNPYGPMHLPVMQGPVAFYNTLNRPDPYPFSVDKLKENNIDYQRQPTSYGRGQTSISTNWANDDNEVISRKLWRSLKGVDMWDSSEFPLYQQPDVDLFETQDAHEFEKFTQKNFFNGKAWAPTSAMLD